MVNILNTKVSKASRYMYLLHAHIILMVLIMAVDMQANKSKDKVCIA